MRRGLAHAVLYVGVCLLWTLLVAYPVLVLVFDDVTSPGALATSALLMSGGALGIAEGWRRLRGWGGREVWPMGRPRLGPRGWLAAVLGTASLGICGEALGTAWWELLSGTFGLTFPTDALAAIAEGLRNGAPGPRVAFALVVVFVGPVLEELVFRGFLWRTFHGDRRPVVAIGLSSLFFAAWHLDPVQSVGVLPLAVFLGVLRWRSASLVAPIAVHIVNNGLAMAAILSGSDEPATLGWLLAAIAAGTLAFALLRRDGGIS